VFEAIRGRLTYANVMATLAVFIALGGASYAAIRIPANSVGNKQLKDNAVRGKEIRNGVVGEKDLKDGAVGPDALQGNAVGFDNLAPLAVDGSKVKDGSIPFAKLDAQTVSPRLFAHVNASGVLAENSGNVTSVSRPSTGSYVVTFDRNLNGCVAVANVGFGFGPGVIGAGRTAQARMNMNNNAAAVGVTIYKGLTFNDVENNDFHLIVAC
jgi:hypothetical protein